MRPQADSLKGGRTIASLSEESAALENTEPMPALFFFFNFTSLCILSDLPGPNPFVPHSPAFLPVFR